MKSSFQQARAQRGTTLIEVLIAILVTATGVMGAAAMQINSVKYNQMAKFRSAAVFLANDISDRMRANRPVALAGGYDIAAADGSPTGDEINARDLREWLSELAVRMPQGDGAIIRDGNRFTIVVSWDEKRLRKSREAGEGETGIQEFEFIMEL
ncbi:type IV pilus modification protein PilV [Spongiibacter sp.]|uniref:type IV pilus modification protein PilV n=1 Tax=Spongiibacter sp. TaxID=2024860 RepID=UPI00356687F2